MDWTRPKERNEKDQKSWTLHKIRKVCLFISGRENKLKESNCSGEVLDDKSPIAESIINLIRAEVVNINCRH